MAFIRFSVSSRDGPSAPCSTAVGCSLAWCPIFGRGCDAPSRQRPLDRIRSILQWRPVSLLALPFCTASQLSAHYLAHFFDCFSCLQVYKGAEHPHEAQAPANITNEISIKPRAGPGAALLASKAK